MSGFNRVMQVFLAGALASLGTGLLVWLCSVSGSFAALGVPVDISEVPMGWYLKRMLFGGLWALLFLVPVLNGQAHWMRGLIVALAPTAFLWFYSYPAEGRGILGLASGPLLPLNALFFWVLWGALTGLWLDRVASRQQEEPA